MPNGTSLLPACKQCSDNCCMWGPIIFLSGEWDAVRALATDGDAEMAARLRGAENLMVPHDGGRLLVLNKAQGKVCPFLTEARLCSIYEQRPRDCKIWPLYYPSFDEPHAFTVSSRCPAVGNCHFTPGFVQAAAKEAVRTHEALHGLLHKTTVDEGYGLRVLEGEEVFLGSAKRPRGVKEPGQLRRELQLILLSVLFGFALVEIVKTVLSVMPWMMVSGQRLRLLLALTILLYLVLNSVRYAWAHITLSAYVPLDAGVSGKEAVKVFLHYLVFPLQGMLFVAMALIITVPGIGIFTSLPPPGMRQGLLALYIDTLVAGYVLLNLALAVSDVAWCHLMERMLFLAPDQKRVVAIAELPGWKRSSTEEALLFGLAGSGLILVEEFAAMNRLAPTAGLVGLYLIVFVPWIPLIKELVGSLRAPDMG